VSYRSTPNRRRATNKSKEAIPFSKLQFSLSGEVYPPRGIRRKMRLTALDWVYLQRHARAPSHRERQRSDIGPKR